MFVLYYNIQLTPMFYRATSWLVLPSMPTKTVKSSKHDKKNHNKHQIIIFLDFQQKRAQIHIFYAKAEFQTFIFQSRMLINNFSQNSLFEKKVPVQINFSCPLNLEQFQQLYNVDNKFYGLQRYVIFLYDLIIINFTTNMGCTGSHLDQGRRKNRSNSSSSSLEGCNTQMETKRGQSASLGVMFVGTSMPGWRQENEDSFSIQFLGEDIAIFGVFDGHSGSEISMFAKMNFVKILRNTQSFRQKNYEKALLEAFILLDQFMASKQGLQKLNQIQEILLREGRSTNGKDSQYLAGSTGIVALLTPSEIFIANAGDSRAIMIKNGSIFAQTVDHRADHPKEAQRIATNGGEVIQGRIFGDLNVSRGFGDFAHKPGKDLNKHIVSVLPDLYKFSKDQVDYLLLGSDGIWQKPASYVWDQLHKILQNKQSEQRISTNSMQESVNSLLRLNLGRSRADIYGTDNMTAILIKVCPDVNISNASTTIIS